MAVAACMARSREAETKALAWLREKWHKERAATFEARVVEEHERLVEVFAGPVGLKPSAWPRLPHQLALLAERNVRRQDKLEKERYELEILSMPEVLNAAVRHVQRSSEGHEVGKVEVASPKRRSTTSNWGGKFVHSDTMTSKQQRTAWDFLGRIAAGKIKLKNRRSSTGISLDEMDVERVRNVAMNFKNKAQKSAAARLEQEQARAGSPSAQSVKASKSPRRKSSDRRGSPKQIRGGQSPAKPAPEGKPTTAYAELFREKRPSLGTRGAPSYDGQSSRNSHTGSMRKLLGSRTRKIEDLGPLAIAYQNAAKKAGASCNQAIAEALADSDPGQELRIAGAVLNAVASTALAEVLATCHHLTSIQFTRTVLNQAALEILLPAARTLKLKSLLFLSSNLTPECCPLLVTAFSRPTMSLASPASEWWLCLQHVDLGGNPLGDQGLTALLPVLPQLQALKSLSLRQTGLTDWASPQVEQLLRTMGQLTTLDLGQNQLGPVVGKAVAMSLSACSQLRTLDLSWNPLGSSVQHIGWALIAPRFKGCYRLTSLSLAGCDLEAEDHMALAAFLRFGMPDVPLEKLDLSHVALVGVSAQCLLRQLHRLLPPHPLLPEPTPTPAPQATLLRRSAAAFKCGPAAVPPVQAAPPAAADGRRTGARPQTAPIRRRALTEQQRLEEDFRQEQAREVQPPCLTQVTLMGCRVELDGGVAPKARVKASTFPPDLRRGGGTAGPPTTRPRAPSARAGPDLALDVDARQRLSFGRSGYGRPPLHRFTLDLAVDRPDRIIAQLLVEQELDARLHRIMSWYDMSLNGRVIRKNGRDVVPFDVLYEGWRYEGSIPHKGVLELGVACLPEGASPWWSNNRLQFNAAHMLKKLGEEAAAKHRAEGGLNANTDAPGAR